MVKVKNCGENINFLKSNVHENKTSFCNRTRGLCVSGPLCYRKRHPKLAIFEYFHNELKSLLYTGLSLPLICPSTLANLSIICTGKILWYKLFLINPVIKKIVLNSPSPKFASWKGKNKMGHTVYIMLWYIAKKIKIIRCRRPLMKDMYKKCKTFDSVIDKVLHWYFRVMRKKKCPLKQKWEWRM